MPGRRRGLPAGLEARLTPRSGVLLWDVHGLFTPGPVQCPRIGCRGLPMGHSARGGMRGSVAMGFYLSVGGFLPGEVGT